MLLLPLFVTGPACTFLPSGSVLAGDGGAALPAPVVGTTRIGAATARGPVLEAEGVHNVVFPDDASWVLAESDRGIARWSLETKQILDEREISSALWLLDLAGDGDLTLLSLDGELHLRRRSGAPAPEVFALVADPPSGMGRLSNDGATLGAIGSSAVRIQATATGKNHLELWTYGNARDMRLAPRGNRWLVAGPNAHRTDAGEEGTPPSRTGMLLVEEDGSVAWRAKLLGDSARVEVAWLSDDAVLVANERHLRRYDARTGEPLGPWTPGPNEEAFT